MEAVGKPLLLCCDVRHRHIILTQRAQSLAKDAKKKAFTIGFIYDLRFAIAQLVDGSATAGVATTPRRRGRVATMPYSVRRRGRRRHIGFALNLNAQRTTYQQS